MIQESFDPIEPIRAVVADPAAPFHHHRRSRKENASDPLLEEPFSGFIHLLEQGSEKFVQQLPGLVDQQIFS
jgi:hypothetical protein